MSPLRLSLACLAALLAGACAATGDAEDLVAATAAAHADDRPDATPAATTPPGGRVESGPVTYATVKGQPVNGWLAKPAGAQAGLPALIVIHEWWGLNDNIRQTAERLAAEGYVALAVDLYRGGVSDQVRGAMQLMQGLERDHAAALDNLGQAYRFLDQAGAPQIGVIGWCLGGRWSLRTALLLPEEVDAAVIYYGSVAAKREDLARLSMPVLGLFAEKDPIVKLSLVRDFEATMRELGKDVDIHVYGDGAQHGFANPSGTDYHPQAAEDAWQRTLAFLKSRLAG